MFGARGLCKYQKKKKHRPGEGFLESVCVVLIRLFFVYSVALHARSIVVLLACVVITSFSFFFRIYLVLCSHATSTNSESFHTSARTLNCPNPFTSAHHVSASPRALGYTT